MRLGLSERRFAGQFPVWNPTWTSFPRLSVWICGRGDFGCTILLCVSFADAPTPLSAIGFVLAVCDAPGCWLCGRALILSTSSDAVEGAYLLAGGSLSLPQSIRSTECPLGGQDLELFPGKEWRPVVCRCTIFSASSAAACWRKSSDCGVRAR